MEIYTKICIRINILNIYIYLDHYIETENFPQSNLAFVYVSNSIPSLQHYTLVWPVSLDNKMSLYSKCETGHHMPPHNAQPQYFRETKWCDILKSACLVAFWLHRCRLNFMDYHTYYLPQLQQLLHSSILQPHTHSGT